MRRGRPLQPYLKALPPLTPRAAQALPLLCAAGDAREVSRSPLRYSSPLVLSPRDALSGTVTRCAAVLHP